MCLPSKFLSLYLLIFYITKVQVCHNKRSRKNTVFANLAKMGKTGAGWFLGIKLHLNYQ
ncbi:MAG: hypothetical protein C5B45_03000 [Chlamydiae bacterium]|nr:MAG: hypothetical protein C5B45_03000 [Chlamydiota bacterium]